MLEQGAGIHGPKNRKSRRFLLLPYSFARLHTRLERLRCYNSVDVPVAAMALSSLSVIANSALLKRQKLAEV